MFVVVVIVVTVQSQLVFCLFVFVFVRVCVFVVFLFCCVCLFVLQIPWVDDVGVVKMGGTGKIGGGESSMRLDWPKEVIPSYVPERIQDSPKMVVLLELICRSVHLGEKVLVFRYFMTNIIQTCMEPMDLHCE